MSRGPAKTAGPLGVFVERRCLPGESAAQRSGDRLASSVARNGSRFGVAGTGRPVSVATSQGMNPARRRITSVVSEGHRAHCEQCEDALRGLLWSHASRTHGSTGM